MSLSQHKTCDCDKRISIGKPPVLQESLLKTFRKNSKWHDCLMVTSDPSVIESLRAARPAPKEIVPESLLNFDRELDFSSAHIVATQNGRIVGGMRLVENYRDSSKLREHAHYDIIALSQEAFSSGIVEVGRAWVDTDVKASGLFMSMIRKAAEYGIEHGNRFLALSAGEKLASLYLRIGCQFVQEFTSPTDTERWTLFTYDLGGVSNPREFLAGQTPVLNEGIFV